MQIDDLFEVLQVVDWEVDGEILSRYRPGHKYKVTAFNKAFVDRCVADGVALAITGEQPSRGRTTLAYENLLDSRAEWLCLERGVVLREQLLHEWTYSIVEDDSNMGASGVRSTSARFSSMGQAARAACEHMGWDYRSTPGPVEHMMGIESEEPT